MSLRRRARSIFQKIANRVQNVLVPDEPDSKRRMLLLGGPAAVVAGGAVVKAAWDKLTDGADVPDPLDDAIEIKTAAPQTYKDVYEQACASGLIRKGQFNGLGVVEVPPGGEVVYLRDTINRNMWMTRLVLDSPAPDDLSSVVVHAVTIAGLPMNIGCQDMPASAFRWDGAPVPITFRDEDKLPDEVLGNKMAEVMAAMSASSRHLVMVGQSVVVALRNIGNKPVLVSGGLLADELNPYAMQRWVESTLLAMAVDGPVDAPVDVPVDAPVDAPDPFVDEPIILAPHEGEA